MSPQGRVHVIERPAKPPPPPRSYDRKRTLEKASRAQQRGKRRKAIDLYRKVLADEPDNIELHRRLGPLLAKSRRREEALHHFGQAARGLARRGFPDKAIGLCREAVGFYPAEVVLWEAIADLQLERRRRIEAFHVLLEGRTRMRGRRLRANAIRLLKRACVIDPDAVDPQIELARLLARSRQRAQARAILDRLAGTTCGRDRRRALGARLRIAPTPLGALRWVGALLAPSSPRPTRMSRSR
jgi:tetratricopeptide (TPR) repeat protein